MKTIRLIAAASGLLLATSGAHALPARMIASLKKMDPATRFQQRCDIEAMNRIHRDHPQFLPDEMVPYAFGRAEIDGNVMIARGAAFRSRNVWHRLWYRCRTDGTHMEVVSFDYKIGARVPRKDWSKHYLVPE